RSQGGRCFARPAAISRSRAILRRSAPSFCSLSLLVYGRYCSVRRKFAVLYSRFKLECDHSKSMLLLTRISRAFESHVMWYLNNLMGQEVARGGPASQSPTAAVGVLQSI